MPTLFTQVDLDKLNAAISAGSALQSMTFGEQTFTFRSLDEMLRLRAVMQREINASGTRRLATTSKGV